jgi:hypothetical protein
MLLSVDLQHEQWSTIPNYMASLRTPLVGYKLSELHFYLDGAFDRIMMGRMTSALMTLQKLPISFHQESR